MNPRVRKLAQILRDQKLQALLITNPINVFYLTHLSSPNPQDREITVLATQDKLHIFASPLLAIPNSFSPKLLPQTLKKYAAIGCEANHLTLAEFKKFPQLIPTSGLIENLRLIKDDSEITTIKKSCSITKMAMHHARQYIRPGTSEQAIAWEIEKFLKKHQSGLAFPTIVASGKNSAIPHHTTSNKKIATNDIVLIDLGAKYKNYCGDMTRTFFVGKPTPTQSKIESVIKSAHQAALSDLPQADTAARTIIAKAGFAKYFIHNTGHGLGIDIHESPHLGPNSTDKLEPNMIVTVEPGIYLPNQFGYRHEDTILITKTGFQNLTQ